MICVFATESIDLGQTIADEAAVAVGLGIAAGDASELDAETTFSGGVFVGIIRSLGFSWTGDVNVIQAIPRIAGNARPRIHHRFIA